MAAAGTRPGAGHSPRTRVLILDLAHGDGVQRARGDAFLTERVLCRACFLMRVKMDFNYTLDQSGSGTAALETFDVNADGSATQTAVYHLTVGTVASLGLDLYTVNADPSDD